MKMNDAKELRWLIKSIRAKAFEDVASLIKSEHVTKDDAGLVIMHENDLIGLINAIDAAKPKQKKVESAE